MTVEDLCKLIASNGLERLSLDELRQLFTLPVDDYAEVTSMLLKQTDESILRSACILFLIRPIPDLYATIYSTTLRLHNPSALYANLRNLPWADCTLPDINLEQAEQAFGQLIKAILNDSARTESNEHARHCLTFLMRLDLGQIFVSYHNLVKPIIQAFAHAINAPDPLLRQLVSQPHIQALIQVEANNVEWAWIFDWFSIYYYFASELVGPVINIDLGFRLLHANAQQNGEQNGLALLTSLKDHTLRIREHVHRLQFMTNLLQIAADPTRHNILPPEQQDWPAGLDTDQRGLFLVRRIQELVQELRKLGLHTQALVQQYRSSHIGQFVLEEQEAFDILEIGLARHFVLLDTAEDVIVPKMQEAFPE